ncbi:MAG: Crp/Fnr family transcriptional regulator [Bacteroidales bacterium]|nr:Crp/Fnr family transcriptional regulator [Bacteroidales bacterium]
MRRYFDTSDILCVDLKKFVLFENLTEEELESIEGRITISKLKKGSTLYHESCVVGGIYIVINGIVKVFKTGDDGKEQIVRFAKQGDPLGYRSLVCSEPACTSAESLTEVTVCFISAEDFLKLVNTNPKFSATVLKIACDELGDANHVILNLAQKTVRERLAETLLTLMDSFDLDEEKRLRIALTREDLANIVGTATESVIRLLSEFKSDKLIDLQGRYVKLLNVPQLIKIANLHI